jgi:hypothetical protein
MKTTLEKKWEYDLPTPPRKNKPLGSMSPWVWILEPTHGCNLRCGHCNCRLDPLPKKYHFMTKNTWKATWNIIADVSPTTRCDICVGGEPTLNENIVDFIGIARAISPLTQMQITTNGTQLIAGKVKYKDLFQAGLNVAYVDMYAPRGEHIRLARESGFPFYEYYNAPSGAPSPWTYWGPELKIIVLQQQPENWPQSRLRAGLLGTWFNHLDWEAAKRFGLSPVTQAPKRRCNQPFIEVTVDSRGRYLVCCQDNTGESAGQFGGVHEGVAGFRKFWFGEKMQTIRRRLREKDRAGIDYCSRCGITFSRCDFKHWRDEDISYFWNGEVWGPMGEDYGLLAPKKSKISKER